MARFCSLKRPLIYLPNSPIYYVHFMRNTKEFNWLYQGHQQSNDKKSEGESFLLLNILEVGSCKKKLHDERALLGMKKKNHVSQSLEVSSSSKVKAFILGTELKLIFNRIFSPLYPELRKTNEIISKAQFCKISP